MTFSVTNLLRQSVYCPFNPLYPDPMLLYEVIENFLLSRVERVDNQFTNMSLLCLVRVD